jgi:hypothetical protein
MCPLQVLRMDEAAAAAAAGLEEEEEEAAAAEAAAGSGTGVALLASPSGGRSRPSSRPGSLMGVAPLSVDGLGATGDPGGLHVGDCMLRTAC